MKKISLLIFTFSLFSCGAQKLNGVYCHSLNSGYDVSCLTFNNANKFTYKTEGDLGTYITGKGNYTLQNNILKLKFDKDSIIQKSEVKIENWSVSDKKEADSIDLIFKIYDGYNKELPFYGAYIHNASEDIHNSKLNYANRDGVITFSKPKSSKTESYRIGALFYETVEISLKFDSTKKITITLYPSQPHKVTDTTHIYNLKKIDKMSFLTTADHLYIKAE